MGTGRRGAKGLFEYLAKLRYFSYFRCALHQSRTHLSHTHLSCLSSVLLQVRAQVAAGHYTGQGHQPRGHATRASLPAGAHRRHVLLFCAGSLGWGLGLGLMDGYLAS